VLPLLLPLSQNKQKELLEDLQEISEGKDIPLEDLLQIDEIRNIVDSEKLSPLQRADKIRILLRRKRYPLLSSWEKFFDATLKRMQWPREIKIKHSPFFEDDTVSVAFSFKNREEFKDSLSKLKEMASKQEFPKLLK